MSEYSDLEAQKREMEQREIARIIYVLRQEFIKQKDSAVAMQFEQAVHAVFPFATDWIFPDDEARPQG